MNVGTINMHPLASILIRMGNWELFREHRRSSGRDIYPGGLGDMPDSQGPFWLKANIGQCFGTSACDHQASFPWHSFRERN